MGLSKILNKINKAKSAINSLKGISSKLNSLNYTTQIDKLGEEAEKARETLANKRKSVDKMHDKILAAQERSARNPPLDPIDLQYPTDEELDNYIVFSIRPRRQRNGFWTFSSPCGVTILVHF